MQDQVLQQLHLPHSLEGSGGDSIYKFLYGDQARFFGDEIHSDLKPSKMGNVAMANARESLNTSQFHITLRDDLDYLDGNHTEDDVQLNSATERHCEAKPKVKHVMNNLYSSYTTSIMDMTWKRPELEKDAGSMRMNDMNLFDDLNMLVATSCKLKDSMI
ncbi:hypothetical protein RND71_015742 [Anisodus tanguticus]|uniref:PPIase cyclophilin-type domain-containing protein n=1 Tax=Anisodus tanguticus TaxID=243964 RepID=A0AAE1S7F3_9SOLA|nr:hypothetical protein RND71_015742 [Anisodus tanguticus]